MQQRKICLTKKELHEIMNKAIELDYQASADYDAWNYIDGVFNLLSREQKPTIFSRFAKFIDRHSDNFFMMTFVGMIFLLGKIAIESYFLSIK